MIQNLKLTGAVLAGMVALSACGGAAAPSSSSPAPPQPAASAATSAKPAASASASAKPSASSAPVSSAPASAAKGPIKVGFIVPLTGGLSANGIDGRDGFNLYLSTINDSVAGRKIEVTAVDSVGAAETALAKAKQLVDENHVQLLSGLVSTPECYAMAQYVKQAKVPLLVSVDCGAQGLTITPDFASPYVTRFSLMADNQMDVSADWLYKKGFRKAIIMTADYAAGIEFADFFSSAFIDHGGNIVQELHPPLGTNDFGPYLPQLNPDADVLVVFGPGADGLKFGQQYSNYIGGRKLQIFDLGDQIIKESNLPQLGDKAANITAESLWSPGYDSPVNKAFMQAWKAKYGDRGVTQEVANGYSAAQALVTALQKVNGNVENSQEFLDALYKTDLNDTPRGPLQLDNTHNVVQNLFINQAAKSDGSVMVKLLDTYHAVGQFWDRTPEQLQKFPYGKMKGQWAGMTKEKLGQVLTPPKP